MNTPDRLQELLLACFDGTLDEAGQQELTRWLRASPAARERMRSYLQVEGALRDLARAHCLEEDSPLIPVSTAGKVGPVLPASTSTPRSGGFSWRLARNLTALAAHLRQQGVERCVLLPYNPTWLDKLGRLGSSSSYRRTAVMTPTELHECAECMVRRWSEPTRARGHVRPRPTA